ncbi:uncharacterized protein DSM5745_07018 [Aspergillus mulundensis]|uniref:DNA/RNA-binding domain-containing protein n=1 Tax=Aspergillus mulundensis TaxID=1810919 RepID=A0A3D8RK81_9EURO|nr:Uncharacterized protein DSM5745_07018 [Aspergillus mulundensis]RDW74356.1 Uncharacterized protein DSM5745_07018 [Aspergillus mulundensis]
MNENFSAGREALPVRRRYSGDRKKPVAKQPATKQPAAIGSDAGPEGNSSPGRSHIAVASDDGSVNSNRPQYSATFSYSNPRTDDLASDATSDQLAETAPSGHHPQGFRQPRKAPGARAGTPRSYPVSRTAAENWPGKAGAGNESRLRYSVNSADDLEGGEGPSSQPQHQKLHSSSVLNEGRLPVTGIARQDEVVSLSSASGQPSESSSYGQESAQRLSREQGPAGKVSAADGGTTSSWLLLQADTKPLTEEELINDTQAIYAGLLMVEKRCIALTQHLTSTPLSEQDWQRIINTHHVLIEEHHDFLLIIQQGGPALQRLAEQYSMPNRLWRVGIYGLLEFLRRRLPESLERMLAFLHQAYIQMTILVDLVPRFEDTWFECLGDLSRYHILVEEGDPREREAWAEIARYWYHKVADKSPDVGRIQHHLAPLARPDYTQQLFYYTKSLVCVDSFIGAKQSILTLFNPILRAPRTMIGLQETVAAFVTAHAYLFKGDLKDPLMQACNGFLSSLEQYIGRMGPTFKPQGVYISSCNFAAVLEYAAQTALLPREFFTNAAQSKSMDDIYFASHRFWTRVDDLKTIEADFLETRNSETISPVVFYASCLTFQALSIMLDQTGNKNVYPSFHASLAFLWCLARTPSSMKRVEVLVPWKQIATFLNTLTRNFADFTRIEEVEFPSQGDGRWLPEDFLIRGQVWSQNLYPTGFFNKAPTADEGRNLEPPSRDLERMHRCLWLGVRLATFNRWMAYDATSRKFAATDFASNLADMAQKHNPFYGQNSQTSLTVDA